MKLRTFWSVGGSVDPPLTSLLIPTIPTTISNWSGISTKGICLALTFTSKRVKFTHLIDVDTWFSINTGVLCLKHPEHNHFTWWVKRIFLRDTLRSSKPSGKGPYMPDSKCCWNRSSSLIHWSCIHQMMWCVYFHNRATCFMPQWSETKPLELIPDIKDGSRFQKYSISLFLNIYPQFSNIISFNSSCKVTSNTTSFQMCEHKCCFYFFFQISKFLILIWYKKLGKILRKIHHVCDHHKLLPLSTQDLNRIWKYSYHLWWP